MAGETNFALALLISPHESICFISLSISLCRDIIHVHYRAENFEPYLSQVLKIRWEDELGRKNPLTDKEYRYFLLV